MDLAHFDAAAEHLRTLMQDYNGVGDRVPQPVGLPGTRFRPRSFELSPFL